MNTRTTCRLARLSIPSAGDVSAFAGALTLFNDAIADSTVNHNHLTASSPHGAVTAARGGVTTDGPISFNATSVHGNTIVASGTSGTARGGGVFDGSLPDRTNRRAQRPSDHRPQLTSQPPHSRPPHPAMQPTLQPGSDRTTIFGSTNVPHRVITDRTKT